MSQIATKFITDLAVTTAKINNTAVTTAKIATAAVTSNELATDSVIAVKIAADAVTTVKILDANVSANKLASDSVTTVKILDANVTANKLATDSVTTVKILADAVTGAKIRLDNNQAIRSRNAANSGDVSLLKLDASDIAQLTTATEIATTPGTANAVANKTYVDTAVSGVSSGFGGFSRLELFSGDITNQYRDLDTLIQQNTLQIVIAGTDGVENVDYKLSTVSGVTRIKFLNDWATGGATALVAGDVLYCRFRSAAVQPFVSDFRPDVTDPFSISLWAKWSGGTSQIFFTSLAAFGTGNGFFLYTSSSKVLFIIQNGSSYKQITTNSSFGDSTWHHLLATYDGSNTAAGLKIYVDGSLQASGAGETGTITTLVGTDTVNLGKQVTSGGGGFMAGKMDEVAFFKSELTSGNATSLYNSGAPAQVRGASFAGSLVSYHRAETSLSPADSDTGKIYDRAGFWHDGTTNNTAAGFLSTDTPGGISSKSMSFDGTNDFVVLAN